MISKMKVEELKKYLRMRGLKVSGRKCELVARVFSASENNVKLVKTAAQVEEQLNEEYVSKLLVEDGVIPDPMDITSGWLAEEDGVSFWPMITYGNIFNYLTFTPSTLGSDDLNDYKTSKAYSYFTNGWLGPIMYHPIDEDSKYCFLKGDCRPSERLNDPPHKLWVCVLKGESNRIMSAHCTCMAGMSETCNHIAALLFRVDAAVTCGLTNPSCTAKACEWLPNRKEVRPQKMIDLVLNRDEMKKSKKQKRPLVATPKRNYNPLATCKIKPLELQNIVTALKDTLPCSVLFTSVPTPKIDFMREIVKTVPEQKNVLSVNEMISSSDNKITFLSKLDSQMTPEARKKIEEITCGQSENQAWYLFRKDIVTASKAHEVLTKMKKFKKGNLNVNLWSLFQKVSGSVFINPNIPALKYGREMEPVALAAFKEEIKKEHKNVEVRSCGLFIDGDVKFVGASPDGLVTCCCCSPSCLEIKCPFSISHKSPTDVVLDFLVERNGKKVLKKSHKYYTQCQLQMYATNLKKCFFMVWTSHGFVIDDILYDEDFCKNLIEMVKLFYEKFIDFKFNV